MASVVGLYTGEDITLGSLSLNKVDENRCAWSVTDLDGWWGLPEVELADDPKPQIQDGSYYTTGRYLGRDITLQGTILPLDGVADKAVAARRALNAVLAPLARSRVLMTVDESDTSKVAMVQVSGRPLTRINQATGLLEFDILLRAVDPTKYSAAIHEDSTTLGSSSPGRTYNRTFLYTYGGATTTNTMTVYNAGNYNTEGLFTIMGPVTKPRIEHVESGLYLEFDIVLGIGEYLVVNTRNKSIVYSGASRRNTLTPGSRWFSLSPGQNTIRYSGTQQIPAQEGNPGGTNLFTNPSFETAGATFEARRNLQTNPAARVSVTFTTTAGTTVTRLAEGASWVNRIVVTGSGSTAARTATGTAGIPVTAGSTYTSSFDVKSNGPTRSVGCRISWYNSSGVLVTTTTFVGTPTTSEYVRYSTVQTAPTGAVYAQQLFWIDSSVTGDSFDVRNVLFELASSSLPYFDGTSSPDSDYAPSWLGTPNASISILSATRVTSISGGIRSAQWSALGTYSLRVEADQTAAVTVTGPVTITARSVGQTVTLGGTTITSTSPSQAISIVGSGSLTLGTGYWDKLGDGIIQYFDGSYTGASWTGTPNASTSISPEIPYVPQTVLQLQYRDAWID